MKRKSKAGVIETDSPERILIKEYPIKIYHKDAPSGILEGYFLIRESAWVTTARFNYSKDSEKFKEWHLFSLEEQLNIVYDSTQEFILAHPEYKEFFLKNPVDNEEQTM